MRNLKKFLALVLALMMVFSLMVTAHAASVDIDPFSRFTDAGDVSETYLAAARFLSNIGVFQGAGSSTKFSPTVKINRAQMAAIIYRVATGDVEDKYVDLYKDADSRFTDVDGHWAESYINFCDNAEIIKGDGKGHFYPDTTIDGYQVAAMLLRTLGYTKPGEFTGKGWQDQVARYATQSGVTNKVGVSLASIPERQVVAQMTYNAAVLAERVYWTSGMSYVKISNVFVGKAEHLITGYAVVGSNKAPWGIPTATGSATFNWPDLVVEAEYPVAYPVVYDKWVAETQCDVAEIVNNGNNFTGTTYTNGVNFRGTQLVRATNTVDEIGAQGRHTRIYQKGANVFDIVYVDTFLGVVKSTADAVTDYPAGHVIRPATAVLDIYQGGTVQTVTLDNTNYGLAAGDVVRMNATTGHTIANLATAPAILNTSAGTTYLYDIEKINPVTGVTISSVGVDKTGAGYSINGTYKYNCTFGYNTVIGGTGVTLTYTSIGQTVDLYLDTQGNVLGVTPGTVTIGAVTKCATIQDGINGFYNEYEIQTPTGIVTGIKQVKADGTKYTTPAQAQADLRAQFSLVMYLPNVNAAGYSTVIAAPADDTMVEFEAGIADTMKTSTQYTTMKVNNNTVFFVAQYNYNENLTSRKWDFAGYKVVPGFTKIDDMSVFNGSSDFTVGGVKNNLNIGAFDLTGDGYANFVVVNYGNKQSTPEKFKLPNYAFLMTDKYVADATNSYWTYRAVKNGTVGDLKVTRAGWAGAPSASGLYEYQEFTNGVYQLLPVGNPTTVNFIDDENGNAWTYNAGVLETTNAVYNVAKDSVTVLTVDTEAKVFLVNPTTGTSTPLTLSALNVAPYNGYNLYYQFNNYGWVNLIYVVDEGKTVAGGGADLAITGVNGTLTASGYTITLGSGVTVSASGAVIGLDYTVTATINRWNGSEWVEYSAGGAAGGTVAATTTITSIESDNPLVSGYYQVTLTVKAGLLSASETFNLTV